MKRYIKHNLKKVKSVLLKSKSDKEIVDFKKDIWQTEEIAKSFIKGTNAETVVAADLMDSEVNEYFLLHTHKGDRVLDIGCGHGVVSIYLAENDRIVTSIDISDKLLAELRNQAESRKLDISIKKGDAYNIGETTGSFDVVVARMFLPHFPDWPKVLKEMVRVTKPGGFLLVHFSSAENTQLGKQVMQYDCEFASSPDTTNPWLFYAEANDAQLKKVSAELGISVEERVPVSFFLHNRILGYQLGTNAYNAYMEEVQNYLKNEKVKEFVLWFDKQIVSQCSPALSHFNIIKFKKHNND